VGFVVGSRSPWLRPGHHTWDCAGTIAGADGSRQPTAVQHALARSQDAHVATIAAKLAS